MNPSFLVVDKPAGITSHDVVGVVRRVAGTKKVGHTGTLDPFATGVLPLALGAATRLIQFLDESTKVYDATLRLGEATDTGDLDGEVVEEAAVPALDAAAVDAVLARFVGEQLQTPPPYSAVKYQGKPLYWYARRGETVTVPPRPIVVHALERLALEGDTLRFRVHCGPGTYVRVLGHDLARALGTVGHLVALRRRSSGGFALEDAVTFDELAQLAAAESGHDWRRVLMHRGPREERVPWRPRDEVREALSPWLRAPLAALGGLPRVDVGEGDVQTVRHGRALPPPTRVGVGEHYLLVHGDELLAVAVLQDRGPRIARGMPAP